MHCLSPSIAFVLLGLTSILWTGCHTMGPGARAGAGLGGSTGALAGAAIGSHHGNALEGALIGGALGTLAGATVGDSVDELEYRDAVTRQNALGQAHQQAVSVTQLIQMSGSGLGDELIINQIRSNGCQTRLTTQDLIQLKQQGVSDQVIHAYQTLSRGGAGPIDIYCPYEPGPIPGYACPPIHRPIYRGPPRHRSPLRFGVDIDF